MPEREVILAVDTAGAWASVALFRGRDRLAASAREAMHGQAEFLVPMIGTVLDEAGMAAAGIDRIAVGIGPGSFTGLRVAIAAAKGLSLALGKPICGISNFQASAASAGGAGDLPFLVILDSRREDPYAAWLSPDLGFRQPPAAMGWAEIAAEAESAGAAILTGDGAPSWPGPLPACLHPRLARADAASIARLAADPAFRQMAAPAYLRPPDALPAAYV